MSQVVACDVCGEPMRVSDSRYLALAKDGAKPVCRRNGCERLCGRNLPDIARTSQVTRIAGSSGSAAAQTFESVSKYGESLAKARARKCRT
jgi:hypothetical protein